MYRLAKALNVPTLDTTGRSPRTGRLATPQRIEQKIVAVRAGGEGEAATWQGKEGRVGGIARRIERGTVATGRWGEANSGLGPGSTT